MENNSFPPLPIPLPSLLEARVSILSLVEPVTTQNPGTETQAVRSWGAQHTRTTQCY